MPLTPQSTKDGLRRTRRWVNQMLGRDVRAPITLKCRREFLGSQYGGWCICPDRINAQSVVYSIGVGEDISWDLAMIQRFGVQVHAFDPTPKSIAWVKSQNLPTQFHFHEFGIASFDGVATFSLPRPDFASYSMKPGLNHPHVDVVEAPVRQLTSLMKMLGHQRKIDVLKMDIEGAEIDVIDKFPWSDVQVDQFLVEFHHNVGTLHEVETTRRAIESLNGRGFQLFFNSPVGKEFSFLRVA